MYFRHTIAYINALTRFDSSFIEKLSCRKVWASPARPDDYLRRSVLVELGKVIGDYDLSADLVSECFETADVAPTIPVQTFITAASLAKMLREGTMDGIEKGFIENYYD
ncbi:hypothetical protein N7495_001025 [Penicillium taxi]|uniref:uncharacterized protein n=1 Tax=Penicillium taxi TaxID=168475 RepID=UPI00254597E0|nr:uncharacterized protein N7495_001025 [Penicillium taxi]KAJ5908343.1 hypothetical protein N7495_001025 [Penicillium taxi]